VQKSVAALSAVSAIAVTVHALAPQWALIPPVLLCATAAPKWGIGRAETHFSIAGMNFIQHGSSLAILSRIYSRSVAGNACRK
jgi:hypothetical protein